MKCFILFLIFTCYFSIESTAQSDTVLPRTDTLRENKVPSGRDSTMQGDSMQRTLDTLVKKDTVQQLPVRDTSLLRIPPGFTIKEEPKSGDKIHFSGKEELFYFLVFLFLLFGFLRLLFSKYFNDLFRVFFRTTLKQRQVREQLLQSPLPSIAMNSFFVLSAGLYINFQLQYFGLSVTDNFWIQYLYCMGALASVYFVKFLGLKLTGWLFNVGSAVESYTFIVFIINKMLGMMLLPFLVLLAFTGEGLYLSAMTVSWVVVALLLGYRFLLSYNAARNEIKLNPFHFILYIIAFEIVPLLLIYKLLLMIF